MRARKVKSARLHTPVYIDGIGEIGPSLPSKSKNVIDFAMVATDEGLEIYGKGEEGFVPWTNVQCATYEREAKGSKLPQAA